MSGTCILTRRQRCFLQAMDSFELHAVRTSPSGSFGVPNCGVCLMPLEIKKLRDGGLLQTMAVASGGFWELAITAAGRAAVAPADIAGNDDAAGSPDPAMPESSTAGVGDAGRLLPHHGSGP